ncbi:putative immunoglobulin-blocking virulence protein [Mycoplasma bradburyae]|uniref:putative immunoglobulin-blocking virulence protein n=1 Tax=Mycoplasma bradburyae TaxID=2963128 RepID=UPI0023405F80|nr:putative immunoglobulin-blocking virulence protein [Mycoplasma bradburyae]MDC4182509.1 putative immunoglobulin-blocking virulence protein [Mycoplasma bradburyae]
MLSSKKRKLIKLVTLGCSSLVIASTATLSIVFTSNINNSTSKLIERSDKVDLKNNVADDNQYNANRDFNTSEKPKPVDNRPAPIDTTKKNKEPDKKSDNPTQPVPDDTPEPVTYTPTEYNLDKTTPEIPYDPSTPTASGDKVGMIIAESKKIVNVVRSIISKGLAANTKENKEAFKKAVGYTNNPDFFDSYWNNLFVERNEPGRTKYGFQDLQISLSTVTDAEIEREAKANRTLEIMVPNVSVTYGYKNIDENPYVSFYKKSNAKRLLGQPNRTWNDSPDDILKGDFDGWTKTDITYQFIDSEDYNLRRGDGIEVRHYEPTNYNDPYYKNKEPVNLFILDVDNDKGYDKFIEFLKKAAKTTKSVGVELRNIGKTNTNRNVYNIIKSLPENVKLLRVFIENFNTSSLIALEDRKLDELNIYTTNVVNSDLWGINPLALKHINFIPSLNSYNVGGFQPYPPGATVASTPIFAALKFDRNDDYARVQEGIDIAFNRRSERIFNGQFQGKGAKPVVWDFSDAPIIRSFRGLDLKDATLKTVRLSRDLITKDHTGEHLVYNLSEFNHSQWARAMSFTPSGGNTISFGRGPDASQPDDLILLGKASDISSGWSDLQAFLRYAIEGGSFSKAIYVTDESLVSRISSISGGVPVQYVTPEIAKTYQPKIFKVDNKLNAVGDPLNPNDVNMHNNTNDDEDDE